MRKKKYNFIHKCSTRGGSSGSPILNLNNKLIGIHKEGIHNKYNIGTFLNYPIKEFISLNYNNNNANTKNGLNKIKDNDENETTLKAFNDNDLNKKIFKNLRNFIKRKKYLNNSFVKYTKKTNNDNSPKRIISLGKTKNPCLIPKDYLDEIYYNLLENEQRGIKPFIIYNYMDNQNQINNSMRRILIDWLIEVQNKFQLRDETLFTTVLIIDRFCTIRKISREKYQLLGITSMMIACKFEDIYFPGINAFTYITDNACSKEEMIKLEKDILMALNFDLVYPSPLKFFEYLSIKFYFDKKAYFSGKYLMESFLMDIKFIKYKASVISCACAYIVMKLFQKKGYHEFYSKKYYMLNEKKDLPNEFGVKNCAQDICNTVSDLNKSKYLSCFNKYSKEQFEKVALYFEN